MSINYRYCPVCKAETQTYHFSGVYCCRECDHVHNPDRLAKPDEA